jgi:hypothetical protein
MVSRVQIRGGGGIRGRRALPRLVSTRGVPASSPGGPGPGVWRPTPPAFAPGFAPWVANLTPFTLKEASQFRAAPPPDLTSERYRREYEEVKTLGSATGSARTEAQTQLSSFYNDNFIIMWNRTLRGIADAHLDDIADTSRLFALVNFAMADAFITAWDSKYHYNFWRPITAVREGDTDGNPSTIGDPGCNPFIVTPPYPDHTSGANNVTGATMRILRLYFGTDKFTFPVMSVPVGQTRVYERFSDVADDVVDVRIYQGIHFRSADEAARRQGERVATWVFKHFLRPVHGRGKDKDHDKNNRARTR